jgi:hypothetical protein
MKCESENNQERISGAWSFGIFRTRCLPGWDGGYLLELAQVLGLDVIAEQIREFAG